MLYGIGLILLLLSAAFVGGSVLVPVGMALVGVGLMTIGRRPAHGTKANAKR